MTLTSARTVQAKGGTAAGDKLDILDVSAASAAGKVVAQTVQNFIVDAVGLATGIDGPIVLKPQATDPTAIAGMGLLYTKTSGGKLNLYYRAPSGAVQTVASEP